MVFFVPCGAATSIPGYTAAGEAKLLQGLYDIPSGSPLCLRFCGAMMKGVKVGRLILRQVSEDPCTLLSEYTYRRQPSATRSSGRRGDGSPGRCPDYIHRSSKVDGGRRRSNEWMSPGRYSCAEPRRSICRTKNCRCRACKAVSHRPRMLVSLVRNGA